jgi:ADP-heptose:LPS heptosyltransferase
VKKVLFVGLRAMGDMVLTLSALRAVQDSCPDAKVDYLVESGMAVLFQEEPFVRRVILLPRSGKSHSRISSLSSYIKFLLSIRKERYDVAIDLFSRGPRSRLIVWFSRAARRVGVADHTTWLDRWIYTDRICFPNVLTQVYDQMLFLVRGLGFRTDFPQPRMSISAKNIQKAIGLIGESVDPKTEYLVVFPGSGQTNKNWPASNWEKLVRSIRRTGVHVVVMAGPLDREPYEQLKRLFEPEEAGIQWFLQSDLSVLKGVLALSRGAVGNDAGPLHLAQALGKKVVVLFGPGDHVSYRPYLGSFVRSGLSCSPCQAFVSHCPDNQCMKTIPVEDVLEKMIREGLIV